MEIVGNSDRFPLDGKGEGMLKMNQVDQIKELQRQGMGPQEIGQRLNLNRKTVSRYMAREDYAAAIHHKSPGASRLDPFKAKIDEWLAEDRRMRFKQRHTAKRVHQRLGEEFPDRYDSSYPLVQRYIKAVKAARGDTQGFLELVWAAGEAQADFGEAEILCNRAVVTVKYLVMSFPASNAAYVQVFGGETAECVAQGLKDIFHHLGGVPLRIVFDNASGVGRRVGEKVTLSQLFLRFKCHYGFSVSFCNPASGNEKGNVENKVGYIRRNFFVPIPVVGELGGWNSELLCRCEKDFVRPHYKKPGTIGELFAADRKALAPLPAKPFNVERLEKVHTDGYGKFCLEGANWYGYVGADPVNLVDLFGLTGSDKQSAKKSPIIILSDQDKRLLKSGKFIFPLGNKNYEITDVYGSKRGNHTHKGTDIGTPVGSPVRSVAPAGTVASVMTGDPTYGSYVKVTYQVKGKTVQTLAAHLSSITVKAGDKLQAGQVYALSGGKPGPGAGDSSGPHLHFEVRIDGELVNSTKLLYGD